MAGPAEPAGRAGLAGTDGSGDDLGGLSVAGGNLIFQNCWFKGSTTPKKGSVRAACLDFGRLVGFKFFIVLAVLGVFWPQIRPEN